MNSFLQSLCLICTWIFVAFYSDSTVYSSPTKCLHSLRKSIWDFLFKSPITLPLHSGQRDPYRKIAGSTRYSSPQVLCRIKTLI